MSDPLIEEIRTAILEAMAKKQALETASATMLEAAGALAGTLALQESARVELDAAVEVVKELFNANFPPG